MRKLITPIILGMLLALAACNTDPDADIAEVQLDLDFDRTDQALFAASQALRGQEASAYYPVYNQQLAGEKNFLYFLAGLDLIQKERGPIPEAMKDTLIALQLGPFLADSVTFNLLDTLQEIFPSDFPFEERLSPMLKRYHLHFPEVPLPAFRTHINGYGATIQSVDQVMINREYFSLGLHYFAGPEWPFYAPQLPAYIRRRFSPEYLEVVIAHELAEGTVLPVAMNQTPSLLDKMIREGIRLYLVDRILPSTADSMKLYYTSEQMVWADHFEANIYKELTPKFFNTDFVAHRDYLGEKPFTNEFSDKSAPRLGAYLGWKIVDAYMERNPQTSLLALSQEQDYQKIFIEAKYKP